MPKSQSSLRGIWLAIIILAGLVCAALAGLMIITTGADLVTTAAACGAVFLGVTTLGFHAIALLKL